MSKDSIHNKHIRSNHLTIHVHCNKNMRTVKKSFLFDYVDKQMFSSFYS